MPQLTYRRMVSANIRVSFLELSLAQMSVQVWLFVGTGFLVPLPVHLVAIRTVISDPKDRALAVKTHPGAKFPASGSDSPGGALLVEEASPISAAQLPDDPKGNLFVDNLKESEVLPVPERVHKNLYTPKGSIPTTVLPSLFLSSNLTSQKSMTTSRPRLPQARLTAGNSRAGSGRKGSYHWRNEVQTVRSSPQNTASVQLGWLPSLWSEIAESLRRASAMGPASCLPAWPHHLA